MDNKHLTSLMAMAAATPSIAELFVSEPHRSLAFTFDACGIHADFSRQRVSADLMSALVATAESLDISDKFSRMMSGEVMNATENRAVLHTVLRDPQNHTPEGRLTAASLSKALSLAEDIRNNAGIDAVINIGIGGSDLGPAMATKALRQLHHGPIVRFVSNIDPADFDSAIHGLDPSRTVVVVSSKTFTTLETMHNAERAREWMKTKVSNWSTHFVAATAHPEAATAWGIDESRCLVFGEWVGGRFSLSSTIGFPLMCAIGRDHFTAFLRGMHAMDQHVVHTPLANNLPVIHALIWWANAVLHQYPTVAVVPYSHDLGRLPAYLQQLVMESNGKSVDEHGHHVPHTSPVVWGEPGTNGQHAFFQMLHQGTQVVPVEFVSSVAPMGHDATAHDLLVANMIAQSEALAQGSENTNSHKNFSGNRPSSVLMLDSLSPETLGALLSLYEHSTAVQGWLMGVNSFDQFGVELGKVLATHTATAISVGQAHEDHPLTQALTDWYIRRSR